jgi:hypothetical protein
MLTMARLLAPLGLAFALALLSGCASSAANTASSDGKAVKGRPAAARPVTSDTRIVAFSVSNDNLRVDKVGMRDGMFRADGNMDLAFTATVDGPFDALFLYSTNAKGEPVYGLRADTLARGEEVPAELGSVVDTGNMTLGVAVIENGKLQNADTGKVSVGSGSHALTIYCPNPGMLKAGDHLRLWVRAPNGALVAGPVAPY